MTPQLIGIVVDKGISLLAGVMITLFAFRVIGKRPGQDANADAWFEKYGAVLKGVGIAMIVIQLALIANAVVSAKAGG